MGRKLHRANRPAIETEQRRPDIAALFFASALNHHNAGRLKEAIAAYDAALLVDPHFVAAHSNRCAALLSLGRWREAAAAGDAALARKPEMVEARSNRAMAFVHLGRLDEAVAEFDVTLAARPNNPEAQFYRGMALGGLGRIDDAIDALQAAMRLKPNYAAAYNDLGALYMRAGKPDLAVAAYEAALRIKPDYAEALSNRSKPLADLGRISESLASCDAALRIKPDYAEALSNRGNALAQLGHREEAVASFDAALGIKPDYAEAFYNRGNTLKDLGRIEEAVVSYEAALRIRPDYAEALYDISLVKVHVGDDPHLAVMESSYRNSTLSDVERCYICFALGKAYEDLRRYDEAFARYVEGNALRKRALGYSISDDQAVFGAVMDVFRRAEPRPIRSPIPACAPRPIFIIGMPRSGTTLTEQILASHSQVYAGGEREAMNEAIRAEFDWDGGGWRIVLSQDRLVGIRRRYLASLAELKTSKPVVIDKMTLNFRWLGFILEAIPEARIVCLARDPVAVCWSIFKRYFPTSRLGFAYDLGDLAAYYRMHEDLMAFWRERYPGRIFDLQYERLTEDPEGETRALIEHCGLDWEEACLDFHLTQRTARTASMTQVRQKMYKGSSDAWKTFETHLRPLIEAFDRRR